MKKFIVLLILVAVIGCSACIFSACTSYDYKIGVSQLVPHASLDAATQGFSDELKSLMKQAGKTVKVVVKNAANDTGNNAQIAKNFASGGYDLLLGVSTPSAQALQGANEEIPVLYTAVTDPVDAGLIGSYTDAGLNKNVTGTSDVASYSDQVKLIENLFPDKNDIKLGILYNNAEVNSQVQFNNIKSIAESSNNKNFSIKESTISALTEVEPAMRKLDDCDIIYIPTDNLLASAMANVKTSNTAKKPIVCGAVDMVSEGGVAGLGANYYELGRQTARIAFDILINGKATTEIVGQVPEQTVYSVNQEIAKEIGFTIPQAIIDLVEKK